MIPHLFYFGLLPVFFLFASSIKLLVWPKLIFDAQRAMFDTYCRNRPIPALVGGVGLVGAIAIWVQTSWLGTMGALAILAASAGAIGYHPIWGTWKDGVPAGIAATLSAFVICTGRAPSQTSYGLE